MSDGIGCWVLGLWGLAQDGPSLSLGRQLYVSHLITSNISYPPGIASFFLRRTSKLKPTYFICFVCLPTGVGHHNQGHFIRFLIYVDLATSYHLLMMGRRVYDMTAWTSVSIDSAVQSYSIYRPSNT
jgi:hypothetical protein